VKIGNIYITRHETLMTSPAYRTVITRMARSEVKNYLAQLAEQADMPFGDPAVFLRSLRTMADGAASTNLRRDPDDAYDPAGDVPWTLGETTLPNGHTTTCTCPDKGDPPGRPGYRCSDPDCDEPTHAAWRGEPDPRGGAER
jgi:hypothetical protein